jgi:hypothetical protein
MFSEAGAGNVPSGIPDRLKAYSAFPWARLERLIPPSEVQTNPDWRLQQFDLSFHHAGVRSWWPFDDLLRTLNLLKPSGGPVIGRQFYHWLEPTAEADRHVDRIIYGEPLYDGPESESIHPRVFAYDIESSDAEQFCQLRKQLSQCLAADGSPTNGHLRTAIHYFENGDRRIVPHPVLDSFDAIEPLMFYEAALEALLVLEREGGVENKLPARITAMAGRVNGVARDRAQELGDFVQRVFWLRSKVAHGARPIGEIEDLVLRKPNDEIVDTERNKRLREGRYADILIQGKVFPGFLVNLRELTRLCIGFFCDELSAGRGKAETIDLLK